MRALVSSALALALLAGCTSRPAAPPRTGQLAPVDLSNHPSLDAPVDPDQNGGHVGRAPRRITVAMLKASLQVTTGRQWSQLDALAGSLGQADFAITNAEATDPNLVFAKFLEDGAREVCLATAKADLTAAPADRVLSGEVTAPGTDFTALDDATLRRELAVLSLRFWGLPMGDAEAAKWTTSFRTFATRAKAVNKPEQAFGALCIALLTDPRFFTY